jgi:hypothetical protein
MVAPPVKKEDIKENEDVKEEAVPLQTGADIKQVIRGINAYNQFGDDGSQPVDVVNDYLRSLLGQGYKIVHVQHLRTNMQPDGVTVLSEQMLYVLYKEA